MKRLTSRGAVALLVALSFAPIPALSEPSASAPSTFAVEEYRWAEGRVIDSIYVVGNEKVRDFAVLREMELRLAERDGYYFKEPRLRLAERDGYYLQRATQCPFVPSAISGWPA